MKLRNIIKKYKNYNIFFVTFIIILAFFMISSVNFNESYRNKKKRQNSVKSNRRQNNARRKNKTCMEPQLCDNKTELYKCEDNDTINDNPNMKKVEICKKDKKFKTQSSANKNTKYINCYEDIDPNRYDKNQFLIYECAKDDTETENLQKNGWDLDYILKEESKEESKCVIL